MDPQISSKLREIQIKVKRKKGKNIRYCIISAFILFILFINYYFLKIEIINKIPVEFIFIISLLLFIFITNYLYPLDKEDDLIKTIAEVKDLLDDASLNIDFRQEAYQQLIMILKKYDPLVQTESHWHISINKILNRFTENLRNRIAPAILEDEFSSLYLEKIALAIINQNIQDIENLNSEIENTYEEKLYEDSNYITKLNDFLKTRPGKLFISLLLGYGITIIISYCIATYINQDLRMFISNNPTIIIVGGTGLSALFTQYLVRKK